MKRIIEKAKNPVWAVMLFLVMGLSRVFADGLNTNEYDAFYHEVNTADSYDTQITLHCLNGSQTGTYIVRYSTWEDNSYNQQGIHWTATYTIGTDTYGNACFSDGTQTKTITFNTHVVGDGFATGSPFTDAWIGQHAGAYVDCALFSYHNSSGTGDHGWSPWDPWQYEEDSETLTIEGVQGSSGSYVYGPHEGTVNGGGTLYFGTDVGTVNFDLTIPPSKGAPAANQPYLPNCPVCQSCAGGQAPPPGPPASGMAVAALDKFQAGTAIIDTPVGYAPPVGVGMNFTVDYHQRLANQPGTFNYSNLGAQWNCSWMSYIAGGPANSLQNAVQYAPDGSQYAYNDFPINTVNPTARANQAWTHGTLQYFQSPPKYVLSLPDGSVQTFGLGVGTSPNRQFFLTSITDPQGNVTTLNYDATAAINGQALLTLVTDPAGGQLVMGYDTANPLQITKVTRSLDGLSAKFGYTGGKLTSITDTIGMTSAFHYTSGTTFIDKMTTPYGNTTFSSTDGTGYLEADMTNPLGQTERVEYQSDLSTSLVAGSETSAPSATGLTIDNSNLNYGSSYYWSRRAMADAAAGSITTDTASFYALAQATHWAESSEGTIPVPLSAKNPLEGRLWFNYGAQPDADTVEVTAAGATVDPTVVARLVDTGGSTATQASFAGYNGLGLVTQRIDPLGRTTNYNYATNGIDVLTVKQVNGGGQDTLATMTYNSQHEPLTVKDASGQTTTLTYNTQGQLLTRTDAQSHTTTLGYTAAGGSGTGNYLTLVTGPVSGATTACTYDSANRVHTVTDSEGYVVTYAYDNLDRPVTVTYPDSTTEQTSYHALDAVKTVDRQGRATTRQYDAIRELVSTTDPLGRTTQYGWCSCGGLSSLTDARGSVTNWTLDEQGRMTSKTYADSSSISYAYETNTSRLHSLTDARGNVAVYAYNNDNTLSGTTYTPASGVASTPNVSFTYDTPYNRVLTMVDGTGTTTYAYNAVYSSGTAITGGGRLYTITVPIASTTATVTYGYDAVGRVTSRTIDSGNSVSTTFDALGRVTHVTNALTPTSQDFTYAYVDETNRLSSVTYPSSTGLSTSYSYFGNTGDQRLETIQNFKSSGSTNVSKFDYTYNAGGTIATWTTKADAATSIVNTLSYDGADQLTDAVQSGGGSASNAYAYDPAGNRLAETTGSGTTAGQFNKLNQLTAISSSTTSQTVAGHTSATITSATVDALPATITSGTNFSATVPLPSGTNIISVATQDSSGDTEQQQFSTVTSGSSPTTLAYDVNGNTTTDESGNTYKWDALNRLSEIDYFGSAKTLFAYDGLSRRTQIIEKDSSGTVVSTKNYIWVGSEMTEERDASNAVQKRFFPQGEQQLISSTLTPYYYFRDHLGSVRELLDGSGNILTRYTYDSYGKTTTTYISGTHDSTKQYARMYMHPTSGLYFGTFRPYNSNTWTFPNRDPIGERGGLNLYDYVDNNPINLVDPLGLMGGGRGSGGPGDGGAAAAAADAGLLNSVGATIYDAIDSFSIQNMVGHPARTGVEIGVLKPLEAYGIHAATKSSCPTVAAAGKFLGRALPPLGLGLMVGATIYDAMRDAGPPPPPAPYIPDKYNRGGLLHNNGYD